MIAANAIADERRHDFRDNDFVRAWEDLYHGSLATEDDEFLDALYNGAISDASAISPLNINSAIKVLRAAGRTDQANKVIAGYITAHNTKRIEFFKIDGHNFSADDTIDEGLRNAFSARRAGHVDLRDPIDVLREIGERQNWDEADVALMAKQSTEDFERMFEALRGKEMRNSIETIRRLGQSQREGSLEINKSVHAALQRIAGKSPLRLRKISAMGVEIPSETDLAHGK